ALPPCETAFAPARDRPSIASCVERKGRNRASRSTRAVNFFGLFPSVPSGASGDNARGPPDAHDRPPTALVSDHGPHQGFTITFVSVVAGGVTSITAAVGFDLMTLTSLTTANSSTTAATPIVFSTISTARCLT